jgi:uncharacterized phage-associated protein
MSQKNPIRKITPRRVSQFVPDDEKLAELVVLLARRSEGDPLFGGIKLNKLLFYADFLAYLRFGKPITGQEYFALEQGPALRYKARLWKKMIDRGDIVVRKEASSFFDTEKETTIAMREPNIEKFAKEELNLIFNLLATCREKYGNDLSEWTHRFAGWRLSKEKETIPYSVALVGERQPTRDEIRRGLDLESSLVGATA